jgi:hypothetical protein
MFGKVLGLAMSVIQDFSSSGALVYNYEHRMRLRWHRYRDQALSLPPPPRLAGSQLS